MKHKRIWILDGKDNADIFDHFSATCAWADFFMFIIKRGQENMKNNCVYKFKHIRIKVSKFLNIKPKNSEENLLNARLKSIANFTQSVSRFQLWPTICSQRKVYWNTI